MMLETHITQRFPASYTPYSYCPVHEYEHMDCDEWCLSRRIELHYLDQELRRHWRYVGADFRDRGRSA